MEKPNSELGQGTDDMFSRLLNQGSNHEILKSLTGYVEPSFRIKVMESLIQVWCKNYCERIEYSFNFADIADIADDFGQRLVDMHEIF